MSRHRTVAARKRGALNHAAAEFNDYAARLPPRPNDPFTAGFVAGIRRAAELIRNTRPTEDGDR